MVKVAGPFLVLPTLRAIAAKLLAHWSLVLESMIEATIGVVPPGIT